VKYLAFLRWRDYQKPKHSKPSKIPAPPVESYGERETLSPTSLETSSPTSFTPRVRGGEEEGISHQVSQSGQVSHRLVQVSTEIRMKIEKLIELTDFEDLIDYYFSEMLTEPKQQIALDYSMKWWRKHISQDKPSNQELFEGMRELFRSYSIEKIAAGLLKGARYSAGKYPNLKYIEKIIREWEK